MRAILGAALIIVSATAAEAKYAVSTQHNFMSDAGYSGFFQRHATAYQPMRRVYRHRHIHRLHGRTRIARGHRAVRTAASGGTYLPHPSGCTHYAFCGCGAAVEVFGAPIRRLWLAANWYAFPRSAPAPGNVAVRPHHVFVLRQDYGGGKWLVADYNSGGHTSRLHVRSLAGYTIVNPRGSRA